MKFTERVPKSPRELEQFYLQTGNKLSNTDLSLSEVEMLALCSANTPENYDYALLLLQRQIDEVKTAVGMLADYSHVLQSMQKQIDGLTTAIGMLTNPEHMITRVKKEAEGAMTAHFMGA